MKLYSYFRSSAAYRVRIAFNLKGIGYDQIPIHLQKDGGLNRKPEFRAVNPLMRVPVLKLDSGEILTQSLAIIEYADETHPQPPLLPRDPLGRAKVRAMAQLIADGEKADRHLEYLDPVSTQQNVMTVVGSVTPEERARVMKILSRD